MTDNWSANQIFQIFFSPKFSNAAFYLNDLIWFQMKGNDRPGILDKHVAKFLHEMLWLEGDSPFVQDEMLLQEARVSATDDSLNKHSPPIDTHLEETIRIHSRPITWRRGAAVPVYGCDIVWIPKFTKKGWKGCSWNASLWLKEQQCSANEQSQKVKGCWFW